MSTVLGGLTRLSTIDWPGRLCAVIFMRGCNWRCPWCHNRALVWPGEYAPALDEEEVFIWLQSQAGFLDGVVVTGGEPTVHSDLPRLLKRIKDMGYAVRLDTNASRPEALAGILREKLADALAVDLKAPAGRLAQVVGVPVDVPAVVRGQRLACASGLPVRLRTTLAPHLTNDLIERIKHEAKILAGLSPSGQVEHVFQEWREI